MKDFPYIMKHSESIGCGKDAFYLTKKLNYGDPIFSKDIMWLDGVLANEYDTLICGTCNKLIELLSTEDIVKEISYVQL